MWPMLCKMANLVFLFSKPKVAPLRKKSLPTLELLGVYLAVKGLATLLKVYSNVKIESIFIAVDAQIVLSWLLSSTVKTKNLFAKNRISDINRMLGNLKSKYNVPIHFKYVPTSENPADLLTRGLSLETFKLKFEFWLYGPTWIRSGKVIWPTSELQCLSAASKNIVLHTVISEYTVEPIVPFERYSEFVTLVRIVGRMLKALCKFKCLNNNTLTYLWGSTDLDLCAKIHLLQIMQLQSFPKEILFLKNPRDEKVPDLVNNLNLYLDKNGIIRCDGRIGKTSYFEFDVVNPILLGKGHPLTKLIVEHSHKKVMHLGIQSTLNNIRLSGYWVPRPFQSIKGVISQCITCRKYNSLSFKYPKVTDLPKDRVNLVRPYVHTGIDYTGSITVKENKKECKYYMLIFTCLSIRSLHVELLPDMSVNHLVLALIRFTNLYGIPSHIYSDNGRSLIAGVNLISQVFVSSEFKEHFGLYNIKHITIPLYSPWVGACWERLIKTLKSCLQKTIGRIKPSYFRLVTVLSDIQQAVNSRPLTYRCSENNGLEIITPNSFIRPNANSYLSFKDPKDHITEPPHRSEVLKSINIRDKMLEDFRSTWYQEYLLGLRQLHKNLHQIDFSNKVKIDDIVLIKNPAKARKFWKLGRVLELIPGSDGIVRAVKLFKGDKHYLTNPKI